MTTLQKLILERVMELSQIAFTAHQDLERWRETPLTSPERTALSIKLKSAIEQQTTWINAML